MRGRTPLLENLAPAAELVAAGTIAARDLSADAGLDSADDSPAAEDGEPVPVAPQEDTPPAPGALSENDGSPAEDAPASKGRVSSRKIRRSGKSPKRKPSRSGKGRQVVRMQVHTDL